MDIIAQIILAIVITVVIVLIILIMSSNMSDNAKSILSFLCIYIGIACVVLYLCWMDSYYDDSYWDEYPDIDIEEELALLRESISKNISHESVERKNVDTDNRDITVTKDSVEDNALLAGNTSSPDPQIIPAKKITDDQSKT